MEQRSFGAVLAALRKERGMTQLELAEKMGGHRQGRVQVGAGPVLPGCELHP